MKSAKYSLIEVAKLSQNEESVWFAAKSRSIDKVVEVYLNTDSPMTYEMAVRFILEGLKQLAVGDFVESVHMWNMTCDVYGAYIDNKPWYIKFAIEDGCLTQISFHPPERPLTTISGKTIG